MSDQPRSVYIPRLNGWLTNCWKLFGRTAPRQFDRGPRRVGQGPSGRSPGMLSSADWRQNGIWRMRALDHVTILGQIIATLSSKEKSMVSVKGSRFNVDLKFRILMPLAVTLVASVLAPSVVRAQSWTALNHQPCSPGQPCFFPGTALLLTDGTDGAGQRRQQLVQIDARQYG